MRVVPGLVVAVAAALVSGLASEPVSGSPSGATAAGPRYVALGDSYVSGLGISPVVNEPCSRSGRNFPSLVAAALDASGFTDASCAGAKTTDLERSQAQVPAQLDAVTADTTLVTLGPVGGNDISFIPMIDRCRQVACGPDDFAAAQRAVADLAPVYLRLIDAIRSRAPSATIVAVGYGTVLGGDACEGLTNEQSQELQGVLDDLDDTLAAAAAARGVRFADPRILDWRGHTMCAAAADQWVRGIAAVDGDGDAAHMTSVGMVQVAGVVEQVIRAALTPAPTVDDGTRVEQAARTVRLRATCRRSPRRLVVQVTGGDGLVTSVRFRVGRSTLTTDRRAPFAASRSVRSVVRSTRTKPGTGPIRARVTVRSAASTRTIDLTVRRPGCVR